MDLETYVRKTLEAIHKGVAGAEGMEVYKSKEAVEFDLLVIDTSEGVSVVGNAHSNAEASRVKFTVNVRMPEGKAGGAKSAMVG